MAYSASEARQQLLDTLAEATDELGFAHAEFAVRHGLPGRTFEQQPAGVSPTGRDGLHPPSGRGDRRG
jgi:hypothetical protein